MNCTQITEPSLLNALFLRNSDSELNSSFKCFYKLFYERFEGFVYKRYHITDAAIVKDAFSDGLISFYFKIKNDGFKQSGATIETVFLEFCKRKLWGRFRENERHLHRYTYADPETLPKENIVDDIDYTSIKHREWELENREVIFQQAWQELGDRCRQLLFLRKIEKMDNEEIAAQTGLKAGNINNEVYRCFERLKNHHRVRQLGEERNH